MVVARPSKWGNPYRIEDHGRAQAVALFRHALVEALAGGDGEPRFAAMARSLGELRGRRLACWCPPVDEHGRPVACHADVLLELANRCAAGSRAVRQPSGPSGGR